MSDTATKIWIWDHRETGAAVGIPSDDWESAYVKAVAAFKAMGMDPARMRYRGPKGLARIDD